MFCALIGELLALPELWLLARHKEGEILIMNNSDASTAPNGRASWGAALVAALPLVSFPAALLLERTMYRVLGTVRLGFLFRLLWADALQGGVMPMIFYLLLLGGLLFAWLKGFPRWSYPNLGWLLIFLISEMDVWVLDDPYLWRVWGPFLVTLLLAVLLRPSREPLQAPA